MSINRNLAKFASKVSSDGNSYITITVTVAGGKFVMDGTSQQIVSLAKGMTYRFDVSDSSVSGHPLVFSTDSSNSSAFTTGVSTSGTAGSANAYVEVTLEQDAPDKIFYYCSNHSNMGAMVKCAPVGDANFATFVDTFTFPTSDGSADQVLKTDGSGALSFAAASGGGIASVAADTTPQLGGDLDVNSNSIVSASNGNINITPNGSGKVVIDGLSHPTADGSANQVLKTDGSGNLGFTSISSGIGELSDDTTPQLGGDLDVVTRSIVSTSNRDIAITPNGSGKVVIDGLSHPTADGSANQVLKTDGSGNLGFTTISSGIGELSDDTTPQLGGDLDVVNRSIVSTSNQNINITPHGSGKVVLDGLSYPDADGSANYVLKTNGSGVLGWSAVSSLGGTIGELSDDSTPQLGGNLDVVTRSIVSTSNRDINISPNGTGTVVINTDLDVDNINIDGNSITSKDTNGNINITPNGTGKIVLDGLSFPTSDGSADQVLKTDGSGQLSFTDVSSGGGGSFTATAHGALTDGATVAINADGTVSVIAANISQNIGSAARYDDGTDGSQNAIFGRAAYDTNSNKVVVAYRNTADSGHGYGVVGTVSGNAITFGTPVEFIGNSVDNIVISFDSSANKVLIGYRDYGNSYYGYAVVGTVSGTSISFGSATQFEAGLVQFMDIAFDSNVNKHLLVYQDYHDNTYGKGIVATISGTSVSFGTAVTYVSSEAQHNAVVYDSTNQKLVVAYNKGTTNTEAVVATISGTSVSYGTAAVVNSGYDSHLDLDYDSGSGKIIAVYQDLSDSRGYAAIGTVSGTGISFGTPVSFESDATTYIEVSYSTQANKFLVSYQHGGNSGSLYYNIGTVSGTSVSFGTAAQWESGFGVNGNDAIYDPDTNQHVLVFSDGLDDDKGKAVLFQQAAAGGATLTAENFVGISDGAYANGATATIQTAGSVDDAQSGLTAGQTYYVQASDGSLGLSADTISVVAGTAISATKLLINPDSDPTITTYTDSDVSSHLNTSSASSGQILGWNGSDFAWVADSDASGIDNVVEDTTPQLGGDLDVNGNSIVSASNGNIAITPNGSGKIILDGLSFPTADGSADQVLKTDGSGQLAFATVSGGGGGAPPSGSTLVTENRSKYSNASTLVLTGGSSSPTTYYIAGGTQYRHVSSSLNTGTSYFLRGVNLQGIVAGYVNVHQGGWDEGGEAMVYSHVWDDSSNNFLAFPTGSTYDGQSNADDRILWGASGANYTSGGVTYQPWSYKLGSSSATSINFFLKINASINGTITVGANETVDLLIVDPSSPDSYSATARRWFACKLTY